MMTSTVWRDVRKSNDGCKRGRALRCGDDDEFVFVCFWTRSELLRVVGPVVV